MDSELKPTQRQSTASKLGFSPLLVVAFVLIAMVGTLVDRQNREAAQQELRISVGERIGLIRAKLEGNINGNIQLVRGLISTLKTEPEMPQGRFAELSSHLFTGNSQLRNIAAAPDLIVSLMYPMAGNERAIGLDYRQNAAQRAMAMAVRDGAEIVIAGPVDLVQGGEGIIGRFPVFTGEAGESGFWGIVSAVIDTERLYRDSGLLDPDLPIDVAIIGQDASGGSGAQFFGPVSVLASSPVTAEVALPNGSWLLAAVPKNGWNQPSAAVWWQRLLIIIAGILVLLPIAIAERLSEQRKTSMRDLRIREEHLQRLSRRLELALDASNVGVWELNLETDELVWDDRMRELYDLPPDIETPNVDVWSSTLHPDDAQRALDEFDEALQSRGQYQSNFRVILRNGDIRHIRAKAAVHNVGNAPRIIGLNWDVTADVKLHDALTQAKSQMEHRNAELEATKAKIEHMALHDSLTGLPNRRFLDSELSRPETGEQPETLSHALLIVDLDRFKQINDTFGHAAGDALLVHVSAILRTLARPSDFVARIGGDEFVIVCRQDADEKQLTALAESIVDQMRAPMQYHGKECRFGVSIGISTSEYGTSEASHLLVNADLALYQAKSTGRNRFAFFTPELQANTLRAKTLADDIMRGIEEREFRPYYQLQFDASSHRITGVEALARWHHPKHGILTPDRFLDASEEFNLTAAIDREVLKQTLADVKTWTLHGLDIPRASVNVSAQRLLDPTLPERLATLDIEPGTLSFELVESIFLDDCDDIVLRNIESIKAMGIDIEIDDFGTGRTSIVSLMKLNPRRLKIDRQLIIPMTESRASRKLAKSVIEIGKSLNIEVVAEGVETMRHAELLKKLGCDILQGYAFAQPMPAAELMRRAGNSAELSA
ncbi:MAG: EAL domain-containing protein [Alphaproteobacteria bacterium]|nr:EAL domain-containing protein [Alphaproteobacteria bacterium]